MKKVCRNYAADFFATTAGRLIAVAAGIVWLLLLVMMPLFARKKKPAKGGRYLK